MIFDKKTLEKLAELGRVKIGENKEEKLLSDLKSILGYFEELKEVDVSGVETMTGAVELKNFAPEQVQCGAGIFREDESIKSEAESVDLIDAFPETENGFLKVPGVFN